MTAMTTDAPAGLPRGRALTRADLDAIPDDGYRYELIDGALIVSPAPRIVHQVAVVRLLVTVEGARSDEFLALTAPTDVVLADDTVVQPDLIVARRSDFTDRDLPVAPLLAVEVLSPSTRGIDLLLKKDRLERAGCRHYWVVDPDEPSITAWSLVDGGYQQTGRATGDDPLEIVDPFVCTVIPSALLA